MGPYITYTLRRCHKPAFADHKKCGFYLGFVRPQKSKISEFPFPSSTLFLRDLSSAICNIFF